MVDQPVVFIERMAACSRTQDLYEFIDPQTVACLNTQDKATGAFSGSGVKSDCDEQLLIMLSFTTQVAITSFTFFATNKDQAPRTVKIFSNVLNMDFDDAESRVPTLEFDLNEDDIGKEQQVQLTKFKRVSSLSIFIEDNQSDDEVSIINKIALSGWPLANTDMKNLKKVG